MQQTGDNRGELYGVLLQFIPSAKITFKNKQALY
jgi:hypothetical protein